MEKLQKARYHIVRQRPFMASVGLITSFRESGACPTMAISEDGTVYFNPEFVEELRVEHLGTVLYHEWWHLLLGHHKRLRVYPPDIANLAGDMAVNSLIKSEHLPMPDDAILPEKFGFPPGLSAEEYAELLLKSSQQQGSEQQEAEGPMSGKGGGSGVTGRRAIWEEDGEPSNAEEALEKAARRAALERARRVAAEQLRGTCPGLAERITGDQKQPRANWRELLRQYIHEIVDVEFSYSKPSRRFHGQEIIRPACVPRKDPSVAVVVDTSGSTWDALDSFAAEVAAIVAEIPEARILECDTEVREVTDHTTWRGGGGTDLRVGIRAACESNPSVIVVLTDCDTPWPDEPPDVPVIVANISKHFHPPDWAVEITLEEGER